MVNLSNMPLGKELMTIVIYMMNELAATIVVIMFMTLEIYSSESYGV